MVPATKSFDVGQVERIARALGDAGCIRIVQAVSYEKEWVSRERICTLLAQDDASLCGQLQQLYEAGLLLTGKSSYAPPAYLFNRPVLDSYIAYLQQYCEA